jgi:hypothetical protein
VIADGCAHICLELAAGSSVFSTGMVLKYAAQRIEVYPGRIRIPIREGGSSPRRLPLPDWSEATRATAARVQKTKKTM